MGESPTFSSFMMLPEHLYQVFAQYIVHGRTRAPPEAELVEMLPTFQFGAKTDRRALQSKFKSWAKRMHFENGCLILTNSGKVVIPKEYCDDLVMDLHSKEHNSIEIVITEIRKTYSWTKKNFGMDRDVVVESIMRKCKSENCLRRMRIEIARLSTSFCPNAANSEMEEHFPGLTFGLPQSLPCVMPSHPFRWPIPVPSIFPTNNFPFNIPFFGDIYNLGNQRIGFNQTQDASNVDIKTVLEAATDTKKELAINREASCSRNVTSNNSPKVADKNTDKVRKVKFRKPRNMHEYKMLIEAAQQKPTTFPKILRKKKTHFLSLLGIAPKSICSSRTLKQFRKEQRFKRFMNRECMIYRERKTLRDRNKLIKHFQEKRRTFLRVSPSKKSLNSTNLEKPLLSERVTDKKIPRKLKDVCPSSTKRMKVSHIKKTEIIEVIDIISSDDEIQQENFSLLRENNTEKQANEDSTLENEPKIASDQAIDRTQKNLLGVDSNTNSKGTFYGRIDQKNKENENSNKNKSKENTQNKSRMNIGSEHTKNIKHNSVFKVKPVVVPKPLKNLPAGSGLPNYSNVPLPIKRVPNIVTPLFANIRPKIPANCFFPSPNSNPLSVRQATSSIMQRNHAVSCQNSAMMVYPISVAQTSTNSKVLLRDREKKETFYLIPQYNRLLLPLESQATEQHQAPFVSKELKATDSTSSLPSQSLQQSAEARKEKFFNENILFGRMLRKEKNKIDINQEMARISSWIYRMKANLNPMFHQSLENSVKKLLAQLDIGIVLVREAKRSLMEIENCFED